MGSLLELLSNLGFFALLFVLLVFVHELGHYLMAKAVGIKVEKFSIGMGPTLWKRQKGETEYRLAIIPLGGYVKMAGDDPTKTYTEEEAKRGFLTQKPPAKLLVVFGGPVFNFILPIFIFGAFMALGIPTADPILGMFEEGLPAQQSKLQAGDRVLEIDGVTMHRWQDVEAIVAKSPNQELSFKVERIDLSTGEKKTALEIVTPILAPAKSRFGEDIEAGRIGAGPAYATSRVFFEKNDSPLGQAGVKAFDRVLKVGSVPVMTYEQLVQVLNAQKAGSLNLEIERDGSPLVVTATIPAGKNSVVDRLQLIKPSLVVGHVDPDSPAADSKIAFGDVIRSVEAAPIQSWEEISKTVQASAGKPLLVKWTRQGVPMQASITPKPMRVKDPIMGRDNPQSLKEPLRFGIAPYDGIYETSVSMLRSNNPLEWVSYGFSETWERVSLTVQALAKLVTGDISIKMLGSPIMIYKVAGNSYRMAGGGYQGWFSFLSTLAILSISLGLMNLLPVPVLDGGHATFFTIEWIRGRPVSVRTMEIASQVGLALIAMLFAVVLFNDLVRYDYLHNIGRLFGIQ